MIGKDWKSFNQAWRNQQAEVSLDQAIKALGHWIVTMERIIKRLEPLGILLAVIGLGISIWAFQIDYRDRAIERSLRAWEIVTTDGVVNGGKLVAAQFLVERSRDLSGAQLEGLFWPERDLAGVDFSRSQLKNSDLNSTNLKSANLWGANIEGAKLSDADLRGADLRRAKVIETNLERADLRGALLQDVTFHRAILAQADLRGAYLHSADFTDASLASTDLQETDCFRCRMRNSSLFGTNLRGANLDGSDLSGAKFPRADLAGTRLTHANLSEADLSQALTVTQEQLDAACGNELTLLGPGLSIVACSQVDWFEATYGQHPKQNLP